MQGLLEIGSELTQIPGDPKFYCGSPVIVGAYGSQVDNEILAQVHLTVDLVSLQTQPIVIPSVKIDILRH